MSSMNGDFFESRSSSKRNLNNEEIYCRKRQIFIGNVITIGSKKNPEVIKIIEYDFGDAITFVAEEISYKKDVDSNPVIYGSLRAKVEIQPQNKFDKPFITHRNIKYILGNQYTRQPVDGSKSHIDISVNERVINYDNELLVDNFMWGSPMSAAQDDISWEEYSNKK